VCALPRFFTLGLGVTDGTNLCRVVDDDMLLVLLVLVSVLFVSTVETVTDSVVWEFVVATIIWKKIETGSQFADFLHHR
jgi:hypothetical protein